MKYADFIRKIEKMSDLASRAKQLQQEIWRDTGIHVIQKDNRDGFNTVFLYNGIDAIMEQFSTAQVEEELLELASVNMRKLTIRVPASGTVKEPYCFYQMADEGADYRSTDDVGAHTTPEQADEKDAGFFEFQKLRQSKKNMFKTYEMRKK